MELRAAPSRSYGDGETAVKGTTAASAVQLHQPAASNEFLAFTVHAGAAAFDELREAVARLGRPDNADADLVSGHRLPWTVVPRPLLLIDATDLCACSCGLAGDSERWLWW